VRVGLKVKIENRKSCIYILLAGKFSPKDRRDLEQSKNIVLQTFKEARKCQISKLLFDARSVSTTMEIIDRYYLMDQLGRVYFEYLSKNPIQPLKIAFLSSRKWDDPQKFDETVACNRGIDTIITCDLEEGLKWLGVGPD
jgi:hypothetical protein